jgi:hypothetical protein
MRTSENTGAPMPVKAPANLINSPVDSLGTLRFDVVK